MRVKPQQIIAQLQEQRITPAHAGKTDYQELPCGYLRDHPRACG